VAAAQAGVGTRTHMQQQLDRRLRRTAAAAVLLCPCVTGRYSNGPWLTSLADAWQLVWWCVQLVCGEDFLCVCMLCMCSVWWPMFASVDVGMLALCACLGCPTTGACCFRRLGVAYNAVRCLSWPLLTCGQIECVW
jgi:hypothetical protein